MASPRERGRNGPSSLLPQPPQGTCHQHGGSVEVDQQQPTPSACSSLMRASTRARFSGVLASKVSFGTKTKVSTFLPALKSSKACTDDLPKKGGVCTDWARSPLRIAFKP